MSKIKCCKDCTTREIGCHSVCERYLAEKAVIEKENKRKSESMKRKADIYYGDRRFDKYRGQR